MSSVGSLILLIYKICTSLSVAFLLNFYIEMLKQTNKFVKF